MKINIQANNMNVELRKKSWVSAACRVIANWASPPDGYKLLESNIKRRSRTGRATNLSLRFAYCDSRRPRMTLDDAYAYFREGEGDA